MTPPPTNDTDFANHPVVSCLKSGKWVAKIQHPIRKVCVCVGIYSTPNEAADACTRKKLEYESRSEQEKAASFPTDVTNFDKHVGVRRMKSGKWEARIKHNQVRLQLGSYDTANEAADAYNLSKLELDSQKLVCSGKAGAVYSTESGTPKADDKRPVKADVEQSMTLHRPLHAYRARAGRWRTEIRHPIMKGKKINLGGFDTAEEAANAYNSVRHDLDLMFPGHKKIKQSNNSCKDEAFAEGNSDSTCVSGDPSVSTRVHLGVSTDEAKEPYDSKLSNYRPDSHDLGLKADVEQSQKNQRLRFVYQRKSGRWQTVIRHPLTEARICLGTFDTAEEAKEAYDSKRREFDSMFPGHYKRKQSKDSCELGEQSQKNQRLSRVYPTKSGRWRTEIRHPITKARVCLGTFGTAEEAKEAYDSKRSEFDSMFPGHYKRKQSKDSFELGLKADAEQSQKNQRLKYVYPRKSGRWTTEIRHPITKATIRLGTFDTPEEAKEAYDSKRREFDSMFPSHKTKDSRDMKAGPEQSQTIQRPCCVEVAEKACNSNRREFDLMLSVNNKLKQANNICKGDSIAEAEGKSYSSCVLDDPSASSDGSLVIKTGRDQETGGSMLNENVQSVPMFVTEERGEFDSDVIDSSGQLVGEYSRLDDELWLCRSEDDATL